MWEHVLLKKQKLGPRAFLKTQGVKFDKSIRSLDLAFLRAFPAEKQGMVRDVWERIHMNVATVQELYDLPETREQVSLLVSHDATRMVASLAWFEATIASLGAKSVIEFGAGAGYLLNYLRYSHPELVLAGVERQSNFSGLIDEDDRLIVYHGDYRELSPAQRFDLVLCDFGWDNHDIPSSTKPHSTSEIAGYRFCPGCSDDEIPFFSSMLGAWKGWAKPDAPLAIAGRLMDLIDLRAIVLAAEQHGWHLDVRRSTQLAVTNLAGEKSTFPALVFMSTKQEAALQAIERFLHQHGW